MTILRTQSNARMSATIVHNQTLYLSGQVAKDVTANIQEQTRTTLEKIDELLKEHGCNRERILSAVIYLRDIDNHFQDMNQVWDAWVPDGAAPTRTCVEAHMARANALIEITVVAALLPD